MEEEPFLNKVADRNSRAYPQVPRVLESGGGADENPTGSEKRQFAS